MTEESQPPEATPTPTREHVRLTLAVDASQANGDTVDLFAQEKALYLFRTDSLARQADLARLVAAQGHSIGLIVTEEDCDAALEQLEQGNALLSHIARTRTRIVSAPEGLVAALTERGWQCWQPNAAGSSAQEILASLSTLQNVARVTLPASREVVSHVLARVREEKYDLQQPLETRL